VGTSPKPPPFQALPLNVEKKGLGAISSAIRHYWVLYRVLSRISIMETITFFRKIFSSIP